MKFCEKLEHTIILIVKVNLMLFEVFRLLIKQWPFSSYLPEMRWDSEECWHRYSLCVQLAPAHTSRHRWNCLLIWQPMVTSVSRQMETALGAAHSCFTVCIVTIYWMSTQEIPMIWDGKQKSEECDKMRTVTLLIVFFGLSKSYPKRKVDETRELRAIVPQLLPNYTTSTLPPAHQVKWGTFSETTIQPFSQ